MKNNRLMKEEIKQFIKTYFDELNNDLECAIPNDYIDKNDFVFDKIQCKEYQIWAKELHRKWPKLCRKVIFLLTKNFL